MATWTHWWRQVQRIVQDVLLVIVVLVGVATVVWVAAQLLGPESWLAKHVDRIDEWVAVGLVSILGFGLILDFVKFVYQDLRSSKNGPLVLV
jgi:hypothetical protein